MHFYSALTVSEFAHFLDYLTVSYLWMSTLLLDAARQSGEEQLQIWNILDTCIQATVFTLHCCITVFIWII